MSRFPRPHLLSLDFEGDIEDEQLIYAPLHTNENTHTATILAEGRMLMTRRMANG